MEEEWDWLYRECGRLVASKRKLLKLTQNHLADALGMSRASIANIEAGKQRMQLHLLFKIARLLAVSPYDLVPSLAAASAPAGTNSDAPLRMSDELLIRTLIDDLNFAR